MKTLILILLVFAAVSCGEIPNDVVDNSEPDSVVNVLNMTAPDNFTYSPDDSTFNFSIQFDGGSSVRNVFADILKPNGDFHNSAPITLESGSLANEFTSEYSLGRYDINGRYGIQFSYDNSSGGKTYAGTRYINYFNGQENYPPVISDLNMQDSVGRGVVFTFNVRAYDPNGYDDLKMVYFRLWRPDGSQVVVNPNSGETRFPMYDNGDIDGSGDEIAGDGIFSLKNSFSSSSQTGSWRFEFEAIDQDNLVSNKIIHNIEVN